MGELATGGWLIAVFIVGMFIGGVLYGTAVEKEAKSGRLRVGGKNYDVTPAA
jgi:hypothetical protein